MCIIVPVERDEGKPQEDFMKEVFLLYTLTTWERSYHKSDAHYNTLKMDAKKFASFLEAANVVDETAEDEDGKVIDSQKAIVFNSGLRHTACKVVRIENEKGKTIYLHHDNPVLRVYAPEMKALVEKNTESEAA